MATGKFVIKKDRGGQFRFTLVGRNGQIVATSETYTTKASCMNGIEVVRRAGGRRRHRGQTSREWAPQHSDVKAKAATRRGTKTPAAVAKKAISEAAPAKKAPRTAKTPIKQAADVVGPRRTAT